MRSYDWLKVRVNLPDDPVVAWLSRRLGRSPDEVLGKLLRFWAWADQNTPDGSLPGAAFEDVDRLVRLKGFALALSGVPKGAWLERTDDGLAIPRFEEHNGASAKRRAMERDRKREDRDASAKRPHENGTESGHDADSRGRGRVREKEQPTPTLPEVGKGALCAYCGSTQEQTGCVHQVDHVIPVAAGGTDDPANLVVACQPCNQAKGGRIFSGFAEAQRWLHQAFWSKNRQRWIDHRAYAFGGKPPDDPGSSGEPGGAAKRQGFEPKHPSTRALCESIDVGRQHWRDDVKPLALSTASLRAMDGLLLHDGRAPEAVVELLEWLFGGEEFDYRPAHPERFDWRSAIKTGAALRRNWDALANQRRAELEASHDRP